MMNFEVGDQPFSDERLLLNELTHRFNDEFAAAIGIVSVAMASSTTEEVRAALATVLDRLQIWGGCTRPCKSRITRRGSTFALTCGRCARRSSDLRWNAGESG